MTKLNDAKSVTIGIPAFNEQENIANLLKRLRRQDYGKYTLDKIIVISDGSTDNTIKEVKSVKSKKIVLLKNLKRRGIGVTQNKILENSKSDYLVLLDADVLPYGKKFIQKLIMPFEENEDLGLVGGWTVPLPPTGIFESIIAHGHIIKNYMYWKINKGNNLYLCHGRVRAFSKKFYTKLRWKTGASEDAYSYLECISKGYDFICAKKAKVLFRSPQNYQDHLNQSKRFFASTDRLSRYFDSKLIEKEYKIPFGAIYNGLVFGIKNKPHLTFLYTLIVLYTKFFAKEKVHDVLWTQAASSKSLDTSYNN